MKRFMVATILFLFLTGLMLSGAGCDGGKIDWKQVSQTAIKYALTQLVIPAYDQYMKDEDAVIEKVLAQLREVELVEKYEAYFGKFGINLEEVLRGIYKIIDANWYDALLAKGYDTDAATDETPLWYVSASDFPECFE